MKPEEQKEPPEMDPQKDTTERMLRLTTYLHREIPISGSMGIEVESIGPGQVILSAPLEPNLNHKSTAFGGSLSAIAVLSGWALLHLRLEEAELDAELVIRRNETSYGAAAHGRFRAAATLADEEQWALLARTIKRGRMARIDMRAIVSTDAGPCAAFSGEFVAVPRSLS